MKTLLVVFLVLFLAGCATGYADDRRVVGAVWGQAEIVGGDCVDDPNAEDCIRISGTRIYPQVSGLIQAIAGVIRTVWHLVVGVPT